MPYSVTGVNISCKACLLIAFCTPPNPLFFLFSPENHFDPSFSLTPFILQFFLFSPSSFLALHSQLLKHQACATRHDVLHVFRLINTRENPLNWVIKRLWRHFNGERGTLLFIQPLQVPFPPTQLLFTFFKCLWGGTIIYTWKPLIFLHFCQLEYFFNLSFWFYYSSTIRVQLYFVLQVRKVDSSRQRGVAQCSQFSYLF